MFKIEFIETKAKKKPFDEFINELSIVEQAEVFVAINKYCDLKNKNTIVPSNITKYIRDGIYELRVHHKNKITRSFNFYFIEQRIVFTHGFVKKTDKIPNKEIEKAIKLKNEFHSIQEK